MACMWNNLKKLRIILTWQQTLMQLQCQRTACWVSVQHTTWLLRQQ